MNAPIRPSQPAPASRSVNRADPERLARLVVRQAPRLGLRGLRWSRGDWIVPVPPGVLRVVEPARVENVVVAVLMQEGLASPGLGGLVRSVRLVLRRLVDVDMPKAPARSRSRSRRAGP